jgi:hypothetical protein
VAGRPPPLISYGSRGDPGLRCCTDIMTQPLSADSATGDNGNRFQTIRDDLRKAGFAIADSVIMRPLLTEAGLRDWDGFARSWNDLGPDVYMADGGRYRKRRHAVFSVSADGIIRQPAQPHFQSRDYNPLNGGVQRWFAPIVVDDGEGSALHAILRLCRDMFDALTLDARKAGTGDPGGAPWHVEVHQFRIEAQAGQPGQPTPEGMHRDGVDWVLVLLVGRQNVASGETRIADLPGNPLGSFTLTEPMDAAWVDDIRVKHGVTAIEPLDASQPAYRDVLVVTFRTAAHAGAVQPGTVQAGHAE